LEVVVVEALVAVVVEALVAVVVVISTSPQIVKSVQKIRWKWFTFYLQKALQN